MSFTKKQSDPETLDFPFPSTPEQFKAYLKDRQSKLDAMMRKRKLAKYSLMATTKVEKTGKELQNCEILKTDEARVSEPIPFLFGKKGSELLGAFEDIKKIVGHINASDKKFEELFLKYKEPLALKYEQLIFKDDYGDLDESLVLGEYKNFLSRKSSNLFLAEGCDIYFRSEGRKTSNIFLSLKELTLRKRVAKIFSAKELSPCLDDLSQKLLTKVKKYRPAPNTRKLIKPTFPLKTCPPMITKNKLLNRFLRWVGTRKSPRQPAIRDAMFSQ